MVKKYYELDGKTKGFAMWIFSKNDFARNRRGDIELFKSIESAVANISISLGIRNPYEYKLWIILDDIEIDFDDVERVDDNYEYFYTNTEDITTQLIISPVYKEEVLRLGYFVFENGDKNFTEKEYGLQRNHELFALVKEAIGYIIKHKDSSPISIIKRDKNKHMCIPIKNSTVKIHICFNYQIMTLNQSRKEKGIRCLPYEKFDKFTTIYTYITKDESEPKYTGRETEAIKVQNSIVSYLKNKYPEILPKYRDVEFHGNIFLEV